jgi:hypothetical protein
MFKRSPDFVIGSPESPYLLRWWIIPRNRWFNIYLHKFLRDDDDRALHDHPWWSLSIILRGGYIEHLPGGVVKHRKAGQLIARRATQAHRIELFKLAQQLRGASACVMGYPTAIPAWTLFITGPRIRQWGFHCSNEWRHWRDFIGVKEGEARGNEEGPGCA